MQTLCESWRRDLDALRRVPGRGSLWGGGRDAAWEDAGSVRVDASCFKVQDLLVETWRKHTPLHASQPPTLRPHTSYPPAPVTVAEYVGRAVWDDGLTLEGRTVEMTGFVTPNPDGSWWLTRIGVGCCAADAFGVRVLVRDGPDLPADHWVTVTGTYVTDTGTVPGEIPEMTIDSYLPGEWPINPYEY